MADREGQRGEAGRFTVRPPRETLQPSAPPALKAPTAYRRRGGTMSKLSGLLSFLLIAGLLGFVALGAVKQEFQTPGPLVEEKSVVIPRNTGFSEAADILMREGVIEDALWFRLASMMGGRQLQQGEFLIAKNASVQQVLDTLVAGKPVDRKVTIPEGLTSQQIVARLRQVDFLVGEVTAIPPEGSLLPDTYQVERNTTRDALLARMQREQKRILERIWASRVDGLPLKTPDELVTLASIVEKETGIADERSRVAGVYINRLNTLTGDFINAAGKKEPPMTLDSDPSVIYGVTNGSGVLGRGLLRSELQDETNPYNTYRRRGLPPGPIANPGRAAMEAVANPSRTKELYFVADGTGGHAFAPNLQEHNRNVARWRKLEAERLKAAEEAAAAGESLPAEPPPAEPESDGRQGFLNEGFLPDELPREAMFVELNAGTMQLAEAFTPPKAAQFDGVPSYPVPPRMRKKKNAEPEPLEGTVAPGMADDPESTVPPGEARFEAGAPEGPVRSAGRSRNVTDASEGKKIDPLRLKSYDLNATQVIPKFKDP
jgi:UPF0755 protein